MNIGDELVMRPSVCVSWDEARPKLLPCRVVYIHPERRFYTVEFKSEVTGQTFRESFLYHDRDGADWENRRRKSYVHRQSVAGQRKTGGLYNMKG